MQARFYNFFPNRETVHCFFRHCAILNTSKLSRGCKLIPTSRMLKELTRPPPVVRCFPLVAQLGRYCANFFVKGRGMTIEVPSYGSEQPPDSEPKNVQVPTYKPKATFRWPPDCLWPFMDDGADRDT
jgi:hypothetical protein